MTDRITPERVEELRDQLKFDLEHGSEKRSIMAADLLALLDQPAPPTSGEGEALIKHFENLAWTCRHDPVEVCEKCVRIKALLLSAPKTVAREDIDKHKESIWVASGEHGHAGRMAVERAVDTMLHDLGLRVEDKSEGEDE